MERLILYILDILGALLHLVMDQVTLVRQLLLMVRLRAVLAWRVDLDLRQIILKQ